MDFKTSNEETKSGIYLMQEGNEEPFNIRLHLAKDILTIQEQDVICVSGEPFYSSERTVTIRRQTIGGFGLSIKGGAEHKIPVVISKISKEQKAELSGLLFIGDGILQINGINVRSYRHEEVVQVLRNAGEEVTLTVSFLKKTPAFLKLPLCEDCTCIPSDQSSGTSSPLCDSGLHLNYHPNNTDTLSCSSWPTSPGLRWEKRWVDLRLIPLLHSRLSQYIPGSDACRKNAFQVIAVDGVCSGVIQFPTAEDCLEWLQAIASNISSLTKHNVKKINRNFPVNQQIIYMGWVDEKEQDSVQDRMYSPKFLALRGSSLFKFSAPPVTTWDWTRAEKSFTVYEIMCKILKDNDLLDKRKHCFSVQTESGEDMFFSVELDCELLIWEKAFQMATFLEVERIQCKTYACIMESHLMGLTVDFSMGFVCFDAASKYCGDTSSPNLKDRLMMEKARSSFCSKIKTPNLLKQRSWSFQTSLLCFIVFMLFLLPKLLAWTQCLWRAKAPRLPLGFLPFPPSHVIHRHLNSNTRLDRCWSPQKLSRRTLTCDCGLKWWTEELENISNRTLWRTDIYSGGIKDLFRSSILDTFQTSGFSGIVVDLKMNLYFDKFPKKTPWTQNVQLKMFLSEFILFLILRHPYIQHTLKKNAVLFPR